MEKSIDQSILNLWKDYCKIRQEYWIKIEQLNDKYAINSIRLYGSPVDCVDGILIEKADLVISGCELESYESTRTLL